MDHAATYQRAHDRILELVNDETSAEEVPTCPGWTVKDTVAHLAGFFTAYRSGDKDAFGPDWGDREVNARKDRSLHECIEEWKSHVESPGDLFESRLGPVAASDVLAHEQDLRNAIGAPGGQDDEGIVPAVEMALSFIAKKTEGDGLPSFRVITEDIDQVVGSGEPSATLKTSTFELFRALHGRRTEDQISGFDWDGDADRWPAAMSIFGPPTDRIVEK
jgi:uncharacterized protein (TIGR03083 family)